MDTVPNNELCNKAEYVILREWKPTLVYLDVSVELGWEAFLFPMPLYSLAARRVNGHVRGQVTRVLLQLKRLWR